MRNLFLLFVATASLALAQAQHSVTVTWPWSQGTGGPATGFNIQRATVSGGPYTQIGTVTSATFTCLDSGSATNVLAEGSTYYYVIVAVGPGGSSPPSKEASATIPISPPVAPGTPTAVAK